MSVDLSKEILTALHDIQAKLNQGAIANIRGPVADPGPDWDGGYWGGHIHPGMLRGPIADPGPWWRLMDKPRQAQLKVKQNEMAIQELQKQIDLIKMESELLKEEYKLK